MDFSIRTATPAEQMYSYTRTQFEGIQDRSSANTFSELCSFPVQRRDFYGKCSDRQCNLCCQSGFYWR